MTSTTKEIFERFEIRKSKKQKSAFIEWLTPILEHRGYPVTIEKGDLGARNIIIGDVEKAQVVFTAHYDTCAVFPLPNLITPKAPALYWLWQILICVPVFALILGISRLFSLLGEGLFLVGYWIGFLTFMGLLLFGPANRHTANDNTSGVTAVVDLALTLPVDLQGKAAFVLFDLEEAGLIGSAAFAKKHKKAMKDKLLVNLDCVSDGETMLFCLKKGARRNLDKLKAAFPGDSRITPDFVTKGYIYPSDQANFRCGVGVASLKKTRSGILYMDRIHTPKDTVYRQENIAWLTEGGIRLVEGMGE